MKCKCKLDIVVLEVDEGCPVHKEVSGLQLERENILSALGEHPDSPVDIPQRISDIRDEGRAHFHNLTQLQERLRDAHRKVGELSAEVEKQPLALACTKCGSTIHTDSFHSEQDGSHDSDGFGGSSRSMDGKWRG
jgi:hypothetical protein